MRALIITLALAFAPPAYAQFTPSKNQVLAARTLLAALAHEDDRTPFGWDDVARRLREVHWRLAAPDEIQAGGLVSRSGRLEAAWHTEITAYGSTEQVHQVAISFRISGDVDDVIDAIRAAGGTIVSGDRDGAGVAYLLSAPGKRGATLRRTVSCGGGGAPAHSCFISYLLTY